MSVRWGRYKDRPALIVESRDLRAAVLPRDGGKMASLLRGDKELLAVRPQESYKPLHFEGSYVDAECSGFDDMFPTVDPCLPPDSPCPGIPYPDHGECCRLAYEAEIRDGKAVLRTASRLFPVTYEKTVSPCADGGLRVDYRIVNEGESAFPFLWAGHIMLQGEKGMRLITPFDAHAPARMMFAPAGAKEDALPRDRLLAHAPGTGPAYKFYYLEKMKEGRFGVRYPEGSRLVFSVDPLKLPYLGIWLNNGEFQDLYSVTPEPATTPFDAVDREGFRSVIRPHGVFEFSMHIAWEEK